MQARIKRNLPPAPPPTKTVKGEQKPSDIGKFPRRWTAERLKVLEEMNAEGYSTEQIADEMGASVEAIRHRLRRMKKGF